MIVSFLHNNLCHINLCLGVGKDSKLLLALQFLVYLLRDGQAKPDTTLLILCSEVCFVTLSVHCNLHIIQGAVHVDQIVKHCPNKHPYILVIGTIKSPEQLFLIADKTVVREVEVNSVLTNLLAAYYMFNVCYPRGLVNLFTFLEVFLLHLNPKKVAPCVKLLNGQLK